MGTRLLLSHPCQVAHQIPSVDVTLVAARRMTPGMFYFCQELDHGTEELEGKEI